MQVFTIFNAVRADAISESPACSQKTFDSPNFSSSGDDKVVLIVKFGGGEDGGTAYVSSGEDAANMEAIRPKHFFSRARRWSFRGDRREPLASLWPLPGRHFFSFYLKQTKDSLSS